MLLEETDPFEMDELKERLKDTMDKFRRECASVKQGRSDPEAIRGLMVELPEQLGGRVHFSEIANVGPKPGDARSLLITMFDIEVFPVLRGLMEVFETYCQGHCAEVSSFESAAFGEE